MSHERINNQQSLESKKSGERYRIPFLFSPLQSIVEEYSPELQFEIHKEFFNKNFKDTEAIIKYCFVLLGERKQNGVSCLLNSLDRDKEIKEGDIPRRKDLLDRIEKVEPLLAAYYKSVKEWTPDFAKKIAKLRKVAENDVHIPKNLLHALDVKILLYEITTKLKYKPADLNDRLTYLFQKSLLHLNLSGSRLDELKFQFKDACMLDFSNSSILGCDLTGSNFSNSDFSNAYVISNLSRCNFSNATINAFFNLALSECIDINFNSANLQSAILNPSNHIMRLYAGMDLRHTNLKDVSVDGNKQKEYLKDLLNFIWHTYDLLTDINWGDKEYKPSKYNNLLKLINDNGYDFSGMRERRDDPLTQNDATTLFYLCVNDEIFDERITNLQANDVLDLSPALQKALNTAKASLGADRTSPKPKS